jgi:hypothetical protein
MNKLRVECNVPNDCVMIPWGTYNPIKHYWGEVTKW